MGHFANMTEFEMWALKNCDHCVHWKDGCPVDDAHTLYGYDLCNEKKHPGKVILDLLIPESPDGLDNGPCAMLQRKDGITDRMFADWEKYKEAMNAATSHDR
jgi:hypothetical protein